MCLQVQLLVSAKDVENYKKVIEHKYLVSGCFMPCSQTFPLYSFKGGKILFLSYFVVVVTVHVRDNYHHSTKLYQKKYDLFVAVGIVTCAQ